MVTLQLASVLQVIDSIGYTTARNRSRDMKTRV